jgi:YegS/Rv2252/BmrU family lipid kinase
MRHLFVVNPKAGKGKGLKYVGWIHKYFQGSGDTYHVEFTKGPGDATEIVKRYVGTGDYRVYSIGGDGTLNEVLNGIVNSSSSLSVIAAGSGNDFFRNIDEASGESLLYRTIAGTEKLVDIGKVNGRFFINVASAGIDAEVAYNADRFKSLPLFKGMASYAAGVFYTVFKYKSVSSVVKVGTSSSNKETLLFAVANGKYYGGGMKIAPFADISDGYLDIYHVDRINPFRIMLLFPKLIKGSHGAIKEVSYFRSTAVVISSDREFLLNIDGEISKVSEASFEIVPKGLKLVVPCDDGV